MDSEDERELAREDVVYERHGLELKSDQNFERFYRGTDVDACGPAGGDIRAFRLVQSVEGFHKGRLDLSGRSPRRYTSLIMRVFEFERDLEGAYAAIDAECRHPTEAHRAEYLKLQARIEERGRPGSSRFASSPPDFEQCIHAIVLLRSSAWRETRFKWRLGSYLDIERLRERLQEMYAKMAKHPEPIFQGLYLLDLPPEILDRVMELARIEHVMRFSEACRSLRQITLKYVFQRRTLRLPECKNLDHRQDPGFLAILIQETGRCVAALARDILFLLSRTDISHNIHCLSLDLSWGTTKDLLLNFAVQYLHPSFLGLPLLSGLCDVVRDCTHLRELDLVSFCLSLELAAVMSCLPELRSVTVVEMISSEAALDAALAGTLPQCPAVLNLTQKRVLQDAWVFVALFPRLSNLAISHPQVGYRILQVTDIHTALNAISCIRQICLHQFWNFLHEDLVVMCSFLEARAPLLPGHALALTHLYLAPTTFLDDAERDAVIGLLPSTPHLIALVLESVQHFFLADAARLSHAAPASLLGLTVTLKPNTYWVHPYPCIWPGAGYEYAAALAPLSALREFRWNAYVDWNAPAPARDLRYFENGYPDLEAHEALVIDTDFSWDDGNREGNAGPLAADARVFAAHLPALEVLVWTLRHEEHIFPVESRITRLHTATQVMTRLPTSQEPPDAKLYPDVERDAGWAPSI